MSNKSRIVFVSVILFLILNLQQCRGNYTCYSLPRKDICFMSDASQRTFQESKLFCQNNGGFLLEIYNEDMQRLFEQFDSDVKLSFWAVWLNLVQTSSNLWVWGGSGNYLFYSNWETINPFTYDTPIYRTYPWLDNTGNYQKQSSPSTSFTGTYPWFGSSGNYQSQGINNFTNAIMTKNYKWKRSYDSFLATTVCYQENKIIYPPKFSTKSTTSKPTTDPTSTTTSMTSPQSQLSSTTTTTSSMKANYANSESLSAAIGIGVGVGLGGLVLIIVSSLLIAKFVFHKEIPLPFKSSRSRKSPPHETGSDVINGDYEHIDEKKLGDRSTYTELILTNASDFPTNSPPRSSSKDLIQTNPDTGLEDLSKADYETSLAQTFGVIYYN